MDMKFCPGCGGDTLLRTSASTNANGESNSFKKEYAVDEPGYKGNFFFPSPFTCDNCVDESSLYQSRMG